MKQILLVFFSVIGLQLYANSASTDTAATQLKDLVVTGKKVNIEQQGRNMIISNIKGSELASTGTILDMMAWTPGVMLDPSENIKVIGVAGAPLIYINGVKQVDNSKLQLLSANLVKKIEIIKEPGAEYPSGTECVLKITTSVPLKEIVGLNLIYRTTQRRRFSNHTTANAFGTFGKFDIAASVDYGFSNSHQSASSTEAVIGKNGETMREIATDEQDYIRSHKCGWFAGATYHLSPKDDIQFDYTGSTSEPRRTFANDRRTKTGENVSDLSFDSRNHGTHLQHTLLSSYIHSFDNSTFTLTANYNSKKSDSEEDVYLMPDAILHQTNQSDSHSDLWTVQGDYSWSFKGKDSQSAGVYGGRSSNRTNTDYTSNGVQDVKSSVGWTELYYSTRFDAFNCAFTAGLRGRYEHQRSKSNLNGELENYSKAYFNIVPNLSIWHRFTKSFAMNIFYKYQYELPSFSQLRPSITLDDLIIYETGNPELKVPHFHYLALVGNIKSFQLCVEYKNYRNQIMDITSPIEDTDYFLVKPINMSGCYNVAFEASYNLNVNNRFRLYTYGKVRREHVEYFYTDELVKQNNVSASVYLNGSYSPRSNVSIFATAGYWSPQLVENIRSGSSCNISFGGNVSLLSSRLNLRLAVNDLLKRSVTPSWTSYSPNLKQSRINRYDTRGVTLTATYRFTLSRQKYSELDNADDYWRM